MSSFSSQRTMCSFMWLTFFAFLSRKTTFVLVTVIGFVVVIVMTVERPRLQFTSRIGSPKKISYPPHRKKSPALTPRKITPLPSCPEKHHLVFIKVHKAGSSTIANILFRFGVSRKLTFALPRKGVIISLWRHQPLRLMEPPAGKSYDILCSHAVYSRQLMDNVMAKDTVYMGIVREPLSLLQSAAYFFFPNIIPGENKLRSFLQNPEIVKNTRLLINTMSYEFDLPEDDFYNVTKIQHHLEVLDREFSVIIVMEKMEESLLLIRRLMCWRLQDILYIPRNSNSKKPELSLTHNEKEKLRQLSKADMLLYQFSVKRLDKQISEQSSDIWEELKLYKSMLRRLRDFCSNNELPVNVTLSFPSTLWSEEFLVYHSQCDVFNFDGFEILKYVKRYQYPNTTNKVLQTG